MWNENTACKYYNENPQFLMKNTKIALKNLNISMNLKENKILAGTHNEFKININSIKENITEVKITFNPKNKTQVNLIFNQIDLSTNTINYDDQGNPTKYKK